MKDEMVMVNKEFINALTLYVESMSKVNAVYIQAVRDINEMFSKRLEGISDEKVKQTPIS